MKKGFTLIELLIVIAIIGILVAIILPNLAGARERARDSRRKTDLNNIQQALRLYYNDHQAFPLSAALDWGNSFENENGTIYMSQLPLDPASTSTSPKNYAYTSTGPSYTLTATLENKSDPDIEASQARCTGTEPVLSYSYVVCEQ